MYELRKKIARYFFVVLGIFLVLLDQFVKYEIRTRGGFYICNKGVAFGLPLWWSFIFLAVFILAAMAIKKQDTRNKIQTNSNFKFPISKRFGFLKIDFWDLFGNSYLVSWLLIISGALSNILDRFFYGCVTDYINLRVWPIFNLADVYITIGGAVLIIHLLGDRKLVKKKMENSSGK